MEINIDMFSNLMKININMFSNQENCQEIESNKKEVKIGTQG